MKLQPILLIAFILVIAITPSVLAVTYISYDDPTIHITFDDEDFSTPFYYDTASKGGYSNATWWNTSGITSQPGAEVGTGESYYMDGDITQDYIYIEYLDEINTADWTMCSYVNFTGEIPNNSLFYVYDNIDEYEILWYDTFNTSDKITTGVCSNGDSCVYGIDNNYNFTPVFNTWQFHCLAYNGTDLEVYVDGVKLNQFSYDSWGVFPHPQWNWSSLDLALGGRGYSPNAYEIYGQVDEYYFYEGVLDQSNITALYNNLPLVEEIIDPFAITECTTISVSGNYTVMNNLSGDVGDGCIVINSDDVIINAYDMTITKTGGAEDSAIDLNGHDNLTVNGGTWSGNGGGIYGYGLKFDGASNFEINNGHYIGTAYSSSKAFTSGSGVASNGVFRNNTALGYTVGIFNFDNVLIVNNSFSATITGTINSLSMSGTNFDFINNTVTNVGYISLGSNMKISGNVFDGFASVRVEGDTNNSIHNNSFSGAGSNGNFYSSSSSGDLNFEVFDNYFFGGTFLRVTTGVVQTMVVYDNVFNGTTVNSAWVTDSLHFNKSGVGNTWTNPTNTGFSDTCTNDGGGVCEEDYVFGTSADYHPVALSVYCESIWSCIGYDTPVCLLNDTSTAICNSVNDTNSCGRVYDGDYTEFNNQTGVCDYCTPSWSCDGYSEGTCNISTNTRNDTCNSVVDSNSCFAITGLPSDEYSGDYSEFPQEVNSCEASRSLRAVYIQGFFLTMLPLMIIIFLFLGNTRTQNVISQDTANKVTGVLALLFLLALITLL